MTKAQQQNSMILVLVILGLVVINSIFFSFQLDLTANQAHSLNDKTVELLRGLEDPVSITYYLSPVLKEFSPNVQNVQGIEDMLQRFDAVSPQISLSQINPDDLEGPDLQNLINLGLMPQGFEQNENTRTVRGEFYSGIVLDGNGRTEVIPFLFQTNTLEYDLLSRILLLLETQRPKLGFLLGDNEQSYEQNFRLFTQELGTSFEIRTLNPGEVIASDLDLLVVAGNKDLSAADAYYINQFIMEGGRVFFAVEGMALNSSGQGMAAFPLENTPMVRLLTSYGVGVRSQFLLDKANKAITQGNAFRGFPLFTRTLATGVNFDHPITQQFTGLDLYIGSPLQIDPPEGLEATVLTKSTDQSWLAPNMVSFTPDQVDVTEFTATEFGPFDTSVILQGTIPSAFPGDPPPGVTGTGTVYEESLEPNAIFVVGDSDFMTDIFIRLAWRGFPEIPNQGIGSSEYNIQFFSNVIQFLGANADLLQIKNKPFRSFALNNFTAQNADLINDVLVITNVFVLPLALLIGGLLFAYLRRTRQIRVDSQKTGKAAKAKDIPKDPSGDEANKGHKKSSGEGA
jgi:ABC-type uncharacterized transport system involved in gliding motility auxiliary subunit